MLGTGAILGTAYDLRAETYDYFFPDRSWEMAGWARLARRYGTRVVEWMCGTGELACGLARRGMRVIGVDLVPEMLLVAQRRAVGLQLEQRPVWIEDDVRDARLPRRDNDFSFIAAGSFGHLTAREEQLDVLQTALRAGVYLHLGCAPFGIASIAAFFYKGHKISNSIGHRGGIT